MAALSEGNRAEAIALLQEVRARIDGVAAGDEAVRFQMRRYVAKRLEFDERGTPTQRRRLKELKWKFQRGLCYECAEPLPKRGAELHRLRALDGYTEANTQLLCRTCHEKAQAAAVGVPLD
jgi:RNase P subunit RPR2